MNDKTQQVPQLGDRQAIRTYIDFEKPIAELESKVAELKALNAGDNSVSIAEEISKLQQKANQALVDTYATLLEARDDRPPLSSARAFTALEHLEGKIDIALLHAFRPVAFGS